MRMQFQTTPTMMLHITLNKLRCTKLVYSSPHKSHEMWYGCYGCCFISNGILQENECHLQVKLCEWDRAHLVVYQARSGYTCIIKYMYISIHVLDRVTLHCNFLSHVFNMHAWMRHESRTVSSKVTEASSKTLLMPTEQCSLVSLQYGSEKAYLPTVRIREAYLCMGQHNITSK